MIRVAAMPLFRANWWVTTQVSFVLTMVGQWVRKASQHLAVILLRERNKMKGVHPRHVHLDRARMRGEGLTRRSNDV